MTEGQVDKRNFDVASITRKGKEKRENFVQHALRMDPAQMKIAGSFVKVFSDMFLKKEVGPSAKAYF